MSLYKMVDTVSFNELFKDKFLDQFSANQINVGTAALSLLISLLLGILIFIVYRMTFKGVVYNSSFNMSLIMMTVISTVIIVTISSNVVLSLGMVGALSIVRFRAAIKDPVDIMYLFWAISVGIVVGAQQYLFATVASAIIAVLCFVMFRMQGRSEVYIVVVRYAPESGARVDAVMKNIKARMRNKKSSRYGVELTAEIRESDMPSDLLERLLNISGVQDAVLVNYNGEYCE